MKIIAALAGVLIPVSAFAATGLTGSHSGICTFFFFGYCALIVIVQFVFAVLFFITMVKVIMTVVSENFAVQKN